MSNSLLKIEQSTIHWMTSISKSNELSLSILERESTLTIAKCFEFPIIQRLKNEVEKKQLIKVVRAAILNTAKMFKYSERMELATATTLAIDLIDALPAETLEDILLMLKMARQGLLGSGKGRLDSDTIFTIFLPNYLELKSEAREKQYYQKKHKREQEEIKELATPISDENNKKLDKWLSAAKKRAQLKQKPKNEFVITAHEAFVFRLSTEVHKLSDKELKIEMQKAFSAKLMDAYEIYRTELERRKK